MDESRYSYKFTPIAEDDINNIFDYIALELTSPQAAESLIDKIEDKIIHLCQFPYSCPLLNDEILRDKGYRLLVVNNFNLFYIIKDETIVIMRILHNRMSYVSLLQ